MNEMWSEMTDQARDEYKDYFIRYHNSVAKTGITGKRIKPATVLPQNVVSVFEKAILTKVIYFMIITLNIHNCIYETIVSSLKLYGHLFILENIFVHSSLQRLQNIRYSPS